MRVALVSLEIGIVSVLWMLTAVAFVNVADPSWSLFGLPAVLLSRGGLLLAALGMVHLAWPRFQQ